MWAWAVGIATWNNEWVAVERTTDVRKKCHRLVHLSVNAGHFQLFREQVSQCLWGVFMREIHLTHWVPQAPLLLPSPGFQFLLLLPYTDVLSLDGSRLTACFVTEAAVIHHTSNPYLSCPMHSKLKVVTLSVLGCTQGWGGTMGRGFATGESHLWILSSSDL